MSIKFLETTINVKYTYTWMIYNDVSKILLKNLTETYLLCSHISSDMELTIRDTLKFIHELKYSCVSVYNFKMEYLLSYKNICYEFIKIKQKEHSIKVMKILQKKFIPDITSLILSFLGPISIGSITITWTDDYIPLLSSS